MKEIKLLESLTNKKVTLKESSDSEPRPNRMKRPPYDPSIATSPGRYWQLMGRGSSGLYIQDEMKDMLVDKYGKSKGEQMFDGLLNAKKFGAFYQYGGQLAAEKAWLIDFLKKPSNGDYWQYNYYDLWKEWMNQIGEPIKIASVPEPEVKPEIEKPSTLSNIQVVKPNVFKPVASNPLDRKFDKKDEMRINDLVKRANAGRSGLDATEKILSLGRQMAVSITDADKAMRRGYAAEAENYHELARIFFYRAEKLGA